MSTSFHDNLDLAKTVFESIEPNELSDATLSRLQALFPEKMVVAALDIIDRMNVTHCITPWGHTEYQVFSSLQSYTVFLDLANAKLPHSCTCPAFMSSALMTNSQIMCKHILATMIARRMKLCLERPTTADELAAIYMEQHRTDSIETAS